MPAKWSDFERFLRADHLPTGRAVYTIADVRIEEVHVQGKPEQKPVAYFREIKQGLVLSPTNQRKLAEMFGDDVAACYGQRITVEARPMRVAGRQTTPIRIAAAAAVAQAPAATSAPAKSQPVAPDPDAAANTQAVVSRLDGTARASQPPLPTGEDYRTAARPWNGPQVVAALADAARMASARHETIGAGVFGVAVNLMENIAGIAGRRIFTLAVFGVEHASDLTNAQRSALVKWVKPDSPQPKAPWVSNNPHFESEFRAVVAGAAKSEE